ncbi:class I SAM-dependent methyltransferase [Candidatus Woesearchaeota archaeon]|nr:MAG: class I SAM-dependent methyltransferase [Candidatus Woesearchaeota archaeon]
MVKENMKTVEEIYDRYAQDYSGDFAPTTFTTSHSAMSFANDITWHFILKYIPKNKSIKILDAGAGDGYWSEKLIKSGYKNIVLSDISQKMLDEAKKRLAKTKVSYVKADIANMKEFAANSFDFIFSQFDPVSYCMKPAHALKEMMRVAKKNAYIVASLDTKFRRVSELVEAGQIDKAKHLLKTNISYDFVHPQYNLTWEELEEYAKKAKLQVIEIIGAPVFMHRVDEKVLEKLEQDKKIRKQLLKIELENCTNKSLVNFAGHLQIVCKKR